MKALITVIAAVLLLATGPAQADWLAHPTVFVATYYADSNSDVLDEFGYNDSKLLSHWKKLGIKEGRRSSPVFDVRYYLEHNPDIAKKLGKKNYIEAAEHWRKFGIDEGRPSHPQFHVKAYLKKNKDVVKKFGANNYAKAVDHYLEYGYDEGRKAV